jgi:predicted molibdopterin-dependent oxidoreductase YjgC
MDGLSRDTDVLFVFGSHLPGIYRDGGWKAALEKVSVKILVTPHLNELASSADFVLPAAFLAEKSGTLTNADGRVQRIAAIARACADIRPEGQILLDLAREIHLDDAYFGALTGPEAVHRELVKDISFFGARP